MFSLNSRIRPSSSAFRCSCRYSRPFSIAVATCPATAVSSARSSLLNGSSDLLAAEREHGDRRPFEDARHEVVDAVVAPELDFLGGKPRGGNRIVERDRVAGIEPRQRTTRPAARRGTGCWNPKSPIDRKSPEPLVGEHQRHPVDDQRFDDARDQPLAESDDVEIAVQIAREADERAAIVVAIAIEHAIQRVLHRLLDRLRKQHHHDRRERGDDPVVRVGVVGEEEADRASASPDTAARWPRETPCTPARA